MNSKPWDRNLQFLLALIIAFNLAPHALTVPLWVTSLAAIAIAWKIFYLTRGFALPAKKILNAATLGGTLGVFSTYSTLLGQEPASALLVVMASLKLLETNRYRDAMLVIFTSYFLLMAHLLSSQSIASAAFMIVDVLLVTSLMFQVHRNDRKASQPWLRPVIRLFALSIPLWIFLFFAFPRFSLGLWNMNSTDAGTGFSDDLNPGAVGRLVESDDTAFRARFNEGPSLSPESLYWRGAALAVGDGMKWSKSRGRKRFDAIIRTGENPAMMQTEIWLEAGYRNWLFALDYPISMRSSDSEFLLNLKREPGFTFETMRPTYSRVEYITRSSRQAPDQMLKPDEIRDLTHLPESKDPKFEALVKRLKADADHDSDLRSLPPAERYSRHVMKLFERDGFRYSKSPSTMAGATGFEQLSDFLFNKKVGFCEHFAASYSTLMRALGIPARVVVGFQGGSPNDLGGYWIVRKLDAHAWSEIWIADSDEGGRGHWERKDPTELVAPLRLQLGGDYYRLDPDSLKSAGVNGEQLRDRLRSGFAGQVRTLQLAWDVLQMRWNAFLVGYDIDAQAELLKLIGVTRSTRLILIFVFIVGALTFGLALAWHLRRTARSEDPALRQWKRFCALLEKQGLSRHLNEGPLAFASRIARQRPERAREIESIARQFTELRYGPEANDRGSLMELKRSVQRFSKASNSQPSDS